MIPQQDRLTVAVVTDNLRLARKVHEIVLRLQGRPFWLEPEHFKHAAAYIRMVSGPYPKQPAGVLIDVLTKGINPVKLQAEFIGSHPPIPAKLVSPASKAEAYKKATLAGSKTIQGVMVDGDDDYLVQTIQEMLYPTMVAEDNVHKLKG